MRLPAYIGISLRHRGQVAAEPVSERKKWRGTPSYHGTDVILVFAPGIDGGSVSTEREYRGRCCAASPSHTAAGRETQLVQSVTDQDGESTVYSYDEADRLTKARTRTETLLEKGFRAALREQILRRRRPDSAVSLRPPALPDRARVASADCRAPAVASGRARRSA